MAQYWLKLSADAQVEGPFAAAEVRQRAAGGELRRDTLISIDQTTWHHAARVKGLFSGAASGSFQPVAGEPASAGGNSHYNHQAIQASPAPPAPRRRPLGSRGLPVPYEMIGRPRAEQHESAAIPHVAPPPPAEPAPAEPERQLLDDDQVEAAAEVDAEAATGVDAEPAMEAEAEAEAAAEVEVVPDDPEQIATEAVPEHVDEASEPAAAEAMPEPALQDIATLSERIDPSPVETPRAQPMEEGVPSEIDAAIEAWTAAPLDHEVEEHAAAAVEVEVDEPVAPVEVDTDEPVAPVEVDTDELVAPGDGEIDELVAPAAAQPPAPDDAEDAAQDLAAEVADPATEEVADAAAEPTIEEVAETVPEEVAEDPAVAQAAAARHAAHEAVHTEIVKRIDALIPAPAREEVAEPADLPAEAEEPAPAPPGADTPDESTARAEDVEPVEAPAETEALEAADEIDAADELDASDEPPEMDAASVVESEHAPAAPEPDFNGRSQLDELPPDMTPDVEPRFDTLSPTAPTEDEAAVEAQLPELSLEAVSEVEAKPVEAKRHGLPAGPPIDFEELLELEPLAEDRAADPSPRRYERMMNVESRVHEPIDEPLIDEPLSDEPAIDEPSIHEPIIDVEARVHAPPASEVPEDFEPLLELEPLPDPVAPPASRAAHAFDRSPHAFEGSPDAELEDKLTPLPLPEPRPKPPRNRPEPRRNRPESRPRPPAPQRPAHPPPLGYASRGAAVADLRPRGTKAFTIIAALMFLDGLVLAYLLARLGQPGPAHELEFIIRVAANFLFLCLAIAALVRWLQWVAGVHKDLAVLTDGEYRPRPRAAVGFTFIPLFNATWAIFMPATLAAEVNLRLEAAGKPTISRGLVLVCQSLSILAPFVALFGLTPLLYAVSMRQIQAGLNRLMES